MRITKLCLPLLLAAAFLSGCDHVPHLVRDTHNDRRAVRQINRVCRRTPPLVVLAPLHTPSAIIQAAETNQNTLANLTHQVAVIARQLSAGTPLAPELTEGDALILDASNLYGVLWHAMANEQAALARGRAGRQEAKEAATDVHGSAGRAHQRLLEAAAELKRIGITACP